MSKIELLLDVLKHPRNFKYIVLSKYPYLIKDDRKYIEYLWKNRMDYPLNLDNPRTFNEKLQWLKLYDRRPEYTKMVDKYEVKEYVAGIIGRDHIIPTLESYNSIEEIDFSRLPNSFVLKCTHDCGGIEICKDQTKFDKEKALASLNKTLKRDYYWPGREWPYKNVKHRIIAEKYMVDESGYELKDYKFFCFNGEAKFLKIDFNRYTNHQANYYTLDGKFLPFYEIVCPNDEAVELKMPSNMNEMLDIVSKLSCNIPFVRVDLYNINGQIYFGELTLYPASGFGPFEPSSWDFKIGEMLNLHQE